MNKRLMCIETNKTRWCQEREEKKKKTHTHTKKKKEKRGVARREFKTHDVRKWSDYKSSGLTCIFM